MIVLIGTDIGDLAECFCGPEAQYFKKLGKGEYQEANKFLQDKIIGAVAYLEKNFEEYRKMTDDVLEKIEGI